MNIFAVDNDPVAAAKALPDKLTNKMVIESGQMLTPWVFKNFGLKIEKPGQLKLPESDRKHYGVKGFAHHPCSLWLYDSPSNAHWLLEHAFGLADEYWQRYNRYHGSLYLLNEVRNIVYKEFNGFYSQDHTPFVQAMPEEYKIPNDPVQAYRNYLMGAKGYAEWRYCSPPEWWDSEKHKPAREKYLADKERKKLERQNAKHFRAARSLQS